MDIPKLLLVTHKKPDLDAVASIYLWLRAHEIPWDSDLYEMRFVNPGQRFDSDQIEESNLVVIHFDTGKMHDDMNFDHHHLGARDISATGLVWKKLYIPDENPAIDELARIVNHIDNGIKYSTDDLVARNLFSMGFYLSGANKLNPRGSDFSHTMIVGFSMLDAYLANHHEVQSFEKLTRDIEIIETQLGKTVVLYNIPGDSSAIRSYLKKNFNGEDDRGPLVNTCVVKFMEGSIGVIVCIDPSQEQNEEYHEETENYPDTISLSEEMEELYKRLLSIDTDPSSNIYLHYSRFALFVNRSYIIKLPHILEAIGYTAEISRAAEG